MAGPAALGAGISAAGALMGAVAGGIGAKKAAKLQYKYQKKLYRHRYRWAMDDMRKAGLNPILAAGSSQPVPGGVGQADLAGVGGELGRGLANSASKYFELKQAQANIAATEQGRRTANAQEDYLDAEYQRSVSQRGLNETQKKINEAEAGRVSSSAKNLDANTKLIEEGSGKRLTESDFYNKVWKMLKEGSHSARRLREELDSMTPIPHIKTRETGEE